MYGWRAVIGVIDLATSATILHEYYQVVPPGVVPISSRLALPGGETTEAALLAMTGSPDLEAAAKQAGVAQPADHRLRLHDREPDQGAGLGRGPA